MRRFAISSMFLKRTVRASLDLKQVYALAAHTNGIRRKPAALGALSRWRRCPTARSIPSDCGKHDHSPLWRDLSKLAEVAERPKHFRQQRSRVILERPVTETNDVSRRELVWLFGGRRDLWPDALKAITDPAWFKVFQEEQLWSTEDAAWVIAAWVARNFQDRDRLECACEWQERLGRPFTEKIEQRLLHAKSLDET